VSCCSCVNKVEKSSSSFWVVVVVNNEGGTSWLGRSCPAVENAVSVPWCDLVTTALGLP